MVPPLPKEASAIRHMSVRGLKRQSDERKRDRESGHVTNGDCKVRSLGWRYATETTIGQLLVDVSDKIHLTTSIL